VRPEPSRGEGGYLGDEELRRDHSRGGAMAASGIRAQGAVAGGHRVVPQCSRLRCRLLAMYHDQGLPVVKHAGFEHAVKR